MSGNASIIILKPIEVLAAATAFKNRLLSVLYPYERCPRPDHLPFCAFELVPSSQMLNDDEMSRTDCALIFQSQSTP